MKNATGKESRKYDAEELRAQANDATEDGKPAWVIRGLLEQAEEQEKENG